MHKNEWLTNIMLTEAYNLDDSICVTQNQPKLFYGVRSQRIGYP